MASDVQAKVMEPLWKKVGYKTKETYQSKWARVRKKYLKTRVESDPYDHWLCAKCSKWLDKDTVTVDHVIKRSVRPDLVFDPSNFQILCADCHREKDFGMKVKRITLKEATQWLAQ